jgi:hypothetical protein
MFVTQINSREMEQSHCVSQHNLNGSFKLSIHFNLAKAFFISNPGVRFYCGEYCQIRLYRVRQSDITDSYESIDM